MLGAFVVVELRRREPLIDLRLLGDRLFRITNLVSLFSSAAFLGLLFVAPLFLQEGLGVTPLISGLTTFPEALGVLLSTQVVARLYPRVGPRRLMAAGLTAVAILMALLSLVGPDTSLWLMRVLMFLTGAGMACSFLPVQTAAFATISSASTGRASALFNAQIDAVQGDGCAEGLAQAAGFYAWHGFSVPPLFWFSISAEGLRHSSAVPACSGRAAEWLHGSSAILRQETSAVRLATTNCVRRH